MFRTNQFRHRVDDFPVLVDYSSPSSSPSNLDFKDVVSREKVSEDMKPGLKPGWIQFRKDAGKTFVMRCDKTEISLDEYQKEEEDNDDIDDVSILNHLVCKWNQRRIDYDDIHGEGEYEKLYRLTEDEDEYEDDDEDYQEEDEEDEYFEE